MTTRQLLAPDSAPGTGAPAPAPAPVQPINIMPSQATPPPNISAKTALGLGSSPGEDLRAMTDKVRSNQPKATNYTAPVTPPPPVVPAAPAAPEPAAPPAAEPVTPPTPPATPEAPKSIKIGGKEYTPEELEKIVAGNTTPAPAAAPQPPAAPAQPAQAPITPQQLLEMERGFVNQAVSNFDPLFDVSEQEMESVLSGGKEGVKSFKQLLARAAAAAQLQSRKSIYQDFEKPFQDFAQIQERVTAMYQAQEQAQAQAAEARFFGTRPDYAPHADLCRKAYVALAQHYPDQVKGWSEEELHNQITNQVDHHMNAEWSRFLGTPVSDWKQMRKQIQTPAAAPAPQPAPAPAPAPVQYQQPAPAPALQGSQRGPVATPAAIQQHIQQSAITPPVAKGEATPPGAPPVFAPGGAGPISGGTIPNWNQAVANSMR